MPDEPAINKALRDVEERFVHANPLSQARYRAASQVLPAGHSRQTLYYRPFPVTVVKGHGARLTDLDGHQYLDLLNDYGAGLYGHSCEAIQHALHDAIDNGLSFGALNNIEMEFAHLVSARIASMKQLRFVTSGTEACMYSVLLARHATGRHAILAFKGGYHGGFMVCGQPLPPLNVPFEIITCTYNDVNATRLTISNHAAKLAAIIVEPVMAAGGAIPATVEFLEMLREETRRHNICLIFDEVMTGRLSPGGAQELYGILPDITALGKFWGGGTNFGAFGGSAELMRHFDMQAGGGLSQAGTFNNNTLTMNAGVVAIRDVFTPAACVRLNQMGDRLRERLNALARSARSPLQVTGKGSIMTLHWHTRPIRNPNDTESVNSPFRSLFQLEMMLLGYYVSQRGYITLSLALTEDDLNEFVDAVRCYLSAHHEALSASPN
jgi:glutamate-1-semialdehyde 2,1-aminomutase